MRRSTRRSSSYIAPLAEVRDPVRNFSTRFTLSPYVKRIQSLTDEQKSAITRMGFGNLLLVPNHSLSKNLLAELMERWSCEKQAFLLHCGEIKMTLLDVALILGLRVVGNPVLLKDDEPFSDLEEEYGATVWKRKVTLASLESRLDSLGETVSEDFIRAFLLYALGVFLFPNSTAKVDSRYLSFLRNLDDVRQFAWGAAVVEDLSQWLSRRKENNVQYVGGCLIFLQTWSYEHFDIARPHLQDNDLIFPRVCRWDISKSHQRQWFTSRFKDLHDDQVIWTLEPTSGELEIDIIKEALELQDDSKELQSAQNYSSCTSINFRGVDIELQISSGAHREHEVNLENLIVEDTPTKLSTCDEVHREQEVNLEKLIVEDTPTKLSTCYEGHREQEVNLEKLIVEESPLRLSSCAEVQSEQKVNLENLTVAESPTKLSTCAQVHSEQEVNLENLIVEETPTKLNICDEVNREHEINLENLILKNTPEKLSICHDDLKKRIVMLEEENFELKKRIDQIVEENGLLRSQILSNSQLEAQNAELKEELDDLSEQYQNLRLSVTYGVTRIDRLFLDFESETNATE